MNFRIPTRYRKASVDGDSVQENYRHVSFNRTVCNIPRSQLPHQLSQPDVVGILLGSRNNYRISKNKVSVGTFSRFLQIRDSAPLPSSRPQRLFSIVWWGSRGDDRSSFGCAGMCAPQRDSVRMNDTRTELTVPGRLAKSPQSVVAAVVVNLNHMTRI